MSSEVEMVVYCLAILGTVGLLFFRDLRITSVPVGVLSLFNPVIGLCALGVVLAVVVLAVGAGFVQSR